MKAPLARLQRWVVQLSRPRLAASSVTLTHRESLVILEQLYDLLLDIEQRRRDQPPLEDVEVLKESYVPVLLPSHL